MRANLRKYQTVSNESSLVAADPHRVILMLMQGLIDTLAVAKGCFERKDFEGKAKAFNKAIGIIGGLQDGIDRKVNPEIGDNFYELYDYMLRRLGEASKEETIASIDEVVNLITPIKEAWETISQEDKMKAQAMRAQMQANPS
ncbi:flagellar export chaperone FliS [Motilimonas pumila]|uniref:Flagellar secretion chaperone FliS n=1 Tax=Motilimonas pumila TaxID=2303987 RepID=A0A418YGN5_9GAMM|nr:flagellar export chaperone FliS [Motilimonas pumila]RJG49000.1 flagellar export chaperone FliS [Motilimonas pumila]